MRHVRERALSVVTGHLLVAVAYFNVIFLIVFFVFTMDTFNVHILLHCSHIIYHLNTNDVTKIL